VSKRRRRVSCAISASSHVCAEHLSPGPQHACMLNSFHLSLTDAAEKTGANNPGCCPDTAAAAGRHYHGRAGITAKRTRTGCLSRTRFILSCKINILSLHARTRRGVQGVWVDLAGTAAGGTAEAHVHRSGGGHAAALLPAAATPTAGLSICVHAYVSAYMFLFGRTRM
jgi:hypothetical protein